MSNRIPFVPMAPDRAKRASRRLIGVGETLSNFFPALPFSLEQSDFDYEPREWCAMAAYTFAFYFIMMFSALFVVTLAAKVEIVRAMLVSCVAAGSMGMLSFVYIVMYPKLMVSRKIKQVEKNLPYALHHMLIQVRSGVPLFNSMVSIAKSNYGQMTKEFEKIVVEINTGKSEVAALEIMARENPSLHFRRILWQMINALKSGADIAVTLKEIVDNMLNEQRVAIKKYGSELNPMALFYMLLVVIFPTLGIIFMLVLFSFVGSMAFDITFILMGVLVFLFVFQFMFIGMIKSKRPVGI